MCLQKNVLFAWRSLVAHNHFVRSHWTSQVDASSKTCREHAHFCKNVEYVESCWIPLQKCGSFCGRLSMLIKCFGNLQPSNLQAPKTFNTCNKINIPVERNTFGGGIFQHNPTFLRFQPFVLIGFFQSRCWICWIWSLQAPTTFNIFNIPAERSTFFKSLSSITQHA